MAIGWMFHGFVRFDTGGELTADYRVLVFDFKVQIVIVICMSSFHCFRFLTKTSRFIGTPIWNQRSHFWVCSKFWSESACMLSFMQSLA